MLVLEVQRQYRAVGISITWRPKVQQYAVFHRDNPRAVTLAATIEEAASIAASFVANPEGGR